MLRIRFCLYFTTFKLDDSHVEKQDHIVSLKNWG